MGTTAAGNWGPSAGFMRTCTFMQCPLTLALALTLTMWNGEIVTFCVVWTAPLTPSYWDFHTSTGSFSQEKFSIFSPGLVLSELLWDSCSNPNMTAPKWACYSCMCELPHSHATQSPIYNFLTHHDWNSFSIGHGGDGQQQHILIVASIPQNLEVNLHKSEVRNSCTPCPL